MDVFSVSTLVCMIYLLIVHCFAPYSKIFSSYGALTSFTLLLFQMTQRRPLFI